MVALIAADHGLRIKPDTASLGEETTRSVVTAITAVILMDALGAVVFQNTGVQSIRNASSGSSMSAPGSAAAWCTAISICA